jgi:hypothetical protein
MASNVVAHLDVKDNIYPRKERAENKIDGNVALIMALSRAIKPGENVVTSLGALLEHFPDQTGFFIGLNVFEPVQDLAHDLQVLRALANVFTSCVLVMKVAI